MFFWFPFGFLIPAALIFFAVRLGIRIFNEFNRRIDRTTLQNGAKRLERLGLKDLHPFRSQSLEARIFRIAYKCKGKLTISDIVLETGLSVQEAEQVINSMVDNLRVRMEVDDNGMVFYEFPEILRRFEGP